MADLLALADDGLKDRWQKLSLGYTESQGLPELREEVAKTYESVGPQEVLIAAPEEAILLAMYALLEPGDRVVCTCPGYQSLYQLAKTMGCEVAFWEPEETTTWHFHPERLRELLIGARTKLVVWNFPHNPTGALPSLEEYRQIIESVEGAGAWLLSDEMYRLLELTPGARLPAAVDCYERAISLAGMSKVYGLAGLRLGWLVGHDPALREMMQSLKDYTTICAPAPSEVLALVGLRNARPIITTHMDRVAANVEVAADFFARHGGIMCWIPPRAGTVCFPRLAQVARGNGAAAFCDRLLRETGVLLLPSTTYGYGDSHFRLGLGREDFTTGLEILDEYLQRVSTLDSEG